MYNKGILFQERSNQSSEEIQFFLQLAYNSSLDLGAMMEAGDLNIVSGTEVNMSESLLNSSNSSDSASDYLCNFSTFNVSV